MTLGEVNSLMNVAAAGVMAGAGLLAARRAGQRWALTFFLMGVYWFGIYLFIFVADAASYDPNWFRLTFIRPGMTLQFSLTAAMLIVFSKLWTRKGS